MLHPAVALLPLLVVLPWLAYRARRRGFDLQLLGQIGLAAYLAALIGLTFFPLPLPPYDPGSGGIDLNLRPFRTIGPALALGPGSDPFRLLVGNVLAFVPLGLLIPLVRPRHSWRLIAALGLALTLAVETGQLAGSIIIGADYRSADVDDVLVNLVGALVGYGLFRVATARHRGVQ